MSRIVFLLPCIDIDPATKKCAPVGGFKGVYEYANRFVADGYEVMLVFPHNGCRHGSVGKFLYSLVGFCYRKIMHGHHAAEWFKLDGNIKKKFVFTLSRPWLWLRKEDIVFATAFETAEDLMHHSNVPLANKFYFIQDYELWAGSKEVLSKSYNEGMHNIVIAPWLKEKVKEAGADATLVTNGFDFSEFRLTKPIDERGKFEVVMLNHALGHKRCVDAWAALDIVKRAHPELHVSMFGVYDPPADMPSWYTYYRNPSKQQLVDIYNNGAIYVAASDFEGFGLTVGEAMICGCAVACTDNGGFTCMAKDGETALLSKVYDVAGLASNISRLIEDDELRLRIARQGNGYIRHFSWGKSYEILKKLIKNRKEK